MSYLEKVRAFNVKKQNKYTAWKIYDDIDIFTLKKHIIRKAFVQKVQCKITDFIFLIRNDNDHHPSVDDVANNENSKNNLFHPKYDNDLVHCLFSQNHVESFFFLAQFLKLQIFVNNNKTPFEMELGFDDNSFDKLIRLISEECKCSSNMINVFIKDEELNKIDPNIDLKVYQKNGLVAYTFPINIKFKYSDITHSLLLKFNKPLKDYRDELINKFNIGSSKLLFRINDKELPDSTPIHDILEKENNNVIIEVDEILTDKINVIIPYHSKTLKFKFNYKNNDDVTGFITNIQQYLGFQENAKLLVHGTDEALPSKLKVRAYSKKTLFLKLNSENDIEFKRTFLIKGKPQVIEIRLDKKVNHIIKQIADENNTDSSLVKLKFSDTILDPTKFFYSYTIQPKQKIEVVIDNFSDYVNVKIFGNEESIKQFNFGFVQKMAISSIKKSSHFETQSTQENESDSIFVIKRDKKYIILDENKTFGYYNVENNDEIIMYLSNFHLFKYNDQYFPLYGEIKIGEIYNILHKQFNLKQDSFFLDLNGKLYTEERSISTYPNGTIFEIKKKQVLHVLILYEGEHRIDIENTKQTKDLIDEFKKILPKADLEHFQLFNDLDKPLNSHSFLYASFLEDVKDHVYKVQVKKTKPFSFATPEGKFFTEYLPPSIKIKEAKKELKARGKKIEEDSFLIYLGRILDDSDKLSTLINDEDEPIEIESQIPEQITISLHFKDEAIDPIKVKMVQGSTAYDIRCLASQLSEFEDLDKISLESDGNQLNDDEELHEDIQITVAFDQINQNQQKLDTLLYTTQCLIEKYVQDTISTTQDLTKSDSSDYIFFDGYDEDDDNDYKKVDNIFEKGNGTYEASKDLPDTEYIFVFKEVNGEMFKLQLPKNVNVRNVKEKIAERNSVAYEDITIFSGNQRLFDFNVLTALVIPKTVHYFTVKIVDIKKSIQMIK